MTAQDKQSINRNDPQGLLKTSTDVVIQRIDESDIHTHILDHMTEGIFVVQDTTIRYANNAMAELFGIPLDRIIGETSGNFIYPEDQQRLLDINKRRLSGEFTRARYEYRLIDANGTIRWMLSESLSIEWDGRPAVLQYLIDISDRKRYERELAQAYDIIRKSSSVTFLWENKNGWPVAYVSENVVNLFGYTAEEFKTGTISYADLIHPEDLERVGQEVVHNSEQTGCEHFEHKPYRIITKDREIKWIEDKTEIRCADDGTITHYQGVVQDITDKKMAEDERERLIDQLQTALSQIKTLQGLIPICSYCKKVRNDDGYWNQIEEYLSKHSDAHFSHSICPACEDEYFPDAQDVSDVHGNSE